VARRQEEAENHWPGFVDALSTIVMVVTFLLIILGIVIFSLSQQIGKKLGEHQASADSKIESELKSDSQTNQTKEFAQVTKSSDIESEEKSQQQEQSKSEAKAETQSQTQAQTEQQSQSQEVAKSEAQSQSQLEAQSQSQSEAQSQASAQSQSQSNSANPNDGQASGLEGKVGKFKEDLGKATSADMTVDSETKLAVRSQEVRETKEITVASDETDPDKLKTGPVQISSTHEFLTLKFDEKTIKLDEKSDQEVLSFIQGNPDLPKGSKLEIWSFAESKIGSISEARRVAYYRAMNTRNSLLKAKFDKKDITVRVRETDDETLKHKVKVIIKQ
jgi:cytoskeletal protein RodZ